MHQKVSFHPFLASTNELSWILVPIWEVLGEALELILETFSVFFWSCWGSLENHEKEQKKVSKKLENTSEME